LTAHSPRREEGESIARLYRGCFRLEGDEGSTLPLIAAFTALALTVVLVVTAASSLYLERKRLLTVADGAALAAAESFDLDAVTVIGGNVRTALTDDEVQDAARAYLAGLPETGRDQPELISATSPDGRSAEVTLLGAWHPPFASLLLPDGVTVEVTATARSVFQ
jgi:hypothetical protein